MATWVFQGNPDQFCVDRYLTGREHIFWLVKQGANLIRPGDDVFIWRARGSSKAVRGAVAKGTIIALGNYPNDCPELWKTGGPEIAFRAKIRLVRVRLTPSDGMVLAEDLIADPVLSQSSIIKTRNSTNFRLTAEQARRLNALWERTEDRQANG